MTSQAGHSQIRISLFQKFMALEPAGDIGKGYSGVDYNQNNKSQKTPESSSYEGDIKTNCRNQLGVGHDRATSLSLLTFMRWRRKWQPTPVFLPGESVGHRLWGHTESDTTEVTQQQQQKNRHKSVIYFSVSVNNSQSGFLASLPFVQSHIRIISC